MLTLGSSSPTPARPEPSAAGAPVPTATSPLPETPTSRARLDVALVERGVVESRTKARVLVKDGAVSVSGRVVTKPSLQVGPGDTLEVTTDRDDVGRGAIKLRHALGHFGLDVTGVSVVDVGASTGGFTQVVLDSGARGVVALDVGHGQLHPRLIADPRVINIEGVNILDVTLAWWTKQDLPVDIGVVVADLSFISLQKVVPLLAELFPAASLVLLVKPQFEVGRWKTRGGIVHEAIDREEAVTAVMDVCKDAGFVNVSTTPSPISGKKGNEEYLVYSSRHSRA